MFQNKVVVITGGAGGIGKCIADDVEGNGDDGQHDHREEQLIAQRRHGHQAAAGIDQVTQRRGIQRQADADVGDENLVADGGGDCQSHTHGEDGNQVGQQILQDDAPGAGAQATGSQIVVTVSDDDDLVADEAGHAQPSGQAQRKNDGGNTGFQHVRDQNQKQSLEWQHMGYALLQGH